MQEQGSGVSPAIFSVGSMKAQRRRHMHRGRVGNLCPELLAQSALSPPPPRARGSAHHCTTYCSARASDWRTLH